MIWCSKLIPIGIETRNEYYVNTVYGHWPVVESLSIHFLLCFCQKKLVLWMNRGGKCMELSNGWSWEKRRQWTRRVQVKFVTVCHVVGEIWCSRALRGTGSLAHPTILHQPVLKTNPQVSCIKYFVYFKNRSFDIN